MEAVDHVTSAFPWSQSGLVPVTLLCLAIALLYLYGTWPFNTWSGIGVNGPKPLPLFGNTREFLKKGFFSCLREWGKKFGKTYGIYQMRQPMLMTTDLDIIKEVFIKDFANFTDRPNNPPRFPLKPLDKAVLNAKGQQWRRLRHTLTPTFSTSKLKGMGQFITRCCHNLSAAIRKNTEAGKALDVKQVYGSFTLDVICGTAFGFHTNALQEEDNVFLHNVKEMVARGRPLSWASLMAGIFPFTFPLLKMLGATNQPKKNASFVGETIHRVIADRKTNGGKSHVDFLQLMLNSESTEEEISANPEAKRMTTEEIVGQGFIIALAGYETTATTLQYMTYLLTMNPDKQEKLYREIVSALGDKEPTYDNVSNMKYLDCCVREALRYFPPVALVGRHALAERTIKGVTIPAGATVSVSIYGLMQDEEYFPEPDKFLPERFDDENKDAIPSLVREMVFGAGPRQCIGMRLALYEAKMAIVSVLRQFRFVRVPETPEEVTFQTGRGLSMPDRPILVGAQLRSEE